MKKRILAALLASAAVLSFAGCSKDNGSSGDSSAADSSAADSSAADSSAADSSAADDSSNAGDSALSSEETLTILAWTGNSDIKNMVKLFCQEKGYSEDQIVIKGVGDNGEGARDQYAQYLSGDGDADLMCLEADWILQYINDDTLVAPLSDLGITEADYANAYDYTVQIGKDKNGVLKGASFQAAPGGFVYRTDLAEEYLGVKTPEEMQEKVKDWDTFMETAKTVYEASGNKTSLTATEGGLWQVYAANRTQPWVVDGKLVMDTAEDFFDVAKTMADNHYLAGVPQWDPAWYQAGQDGTTMGYFFSTWCMTNSDGSQLWQAEGVTKDDDGNLSGPTFGKYNICQGPTGYFWGGTWLAASTKCDTKDLATEFVKFFTTDADTMQKYAEFTGDFTNNKVAMQAIIDAGTNKNDLLGGQDQFAVLADGANNIKMDGLITEYDSKIKSCLNTAVQDYIAGTYATKEEAVDAFKKSVVATFPDIVVE
ncbi:MAG TPA: carbohydrate ABC transporter substrate-binding protein [Ruminococcaceae bacterium]|mgnify:FL=1|nr:carbohydrate ABC transporter substrate-binding protein [Oscillospiraceae bacterium]